jgi:hypothetical protein
MTGSELLLAAAAEVRQADRGELAEAASHTAYLVGVLRQVGTELGLRPPPQVLTGLQGLRLWSLQLRDLDGIVPSPVEARILPRPTASSAGAEWSSC